MSGGDRMRGFTLIEILIALVIVSVGVLALGGFGVTSLSSSQLANERLTAVHLAEQVLEQWQNDASDNPPGLNSSCQSTGGTVTAPATQTCAPVAGVGITYSIAVSKAAASGPQPSGGGSVTFANFVGINGSAAPVTKVVSVAWSNHGTSHSVYLTHISMPQ